MTDKEIEKKIDIILSNEVIRPTIKWTSIPLDEEEVANLSWNANPPFHSEEPNQLDSQNINLLSSLFDRLNKKEQSLFYNFIKAYLPINNQSGRLALLFLLVKYGFKTAIEEYSTQFEFPHSGASGLVLLKEYIFFHFELLSEEEYTITGHLKKTMAHKVDTFGRSGGSQKLENLLVQHFSDIDRQINQILYERISGELLEGVNFEINQDREKVKHYLKTLGFDSQLIKSIQFVEESYQSADSDFDYKACAGQLRSFISEFTKQISLKVYEKKGGAKPPKSKAPQYLKDQKFFHSKYESNLFDALINYLSSDSVHKLSNDREVARISKNITIEFALLLLQRLEIFLSKD